MLRILLFSIALSIVSQLIILLVPITVTDKHSRAGPSPYREQIDELYSKTSKGLPPHAPEWKQITELRQKNNDWFVQKEAIVKESDGLELFTEVWKKKSTKLSPLLMFLWGSFFFWLTRKKHELKDLSIMISPVILVFIQLLSVLSFILIFCSIMAVFLYKNIKKGQETSN